MKKIVSLVLILGLLAIGAPAIAEDQPIITIQDHDLKIYKIFDFRTGAICYITSMGGITCIHRGNLSSTDNITHEFRKYKERKYNPPHVILLDQPEKKKVESKEPKKKDENL